MANICPLSPTVIRSARGATERRTNICPLNSVCLLQQNGWAPPPPHHTGAADEWSSAGYESDHHISHYATLESWKPEQRIIFIFYTLFLNLKVFLPHHCVTVATGQAEGHRGKFIWLYCSLCMLVFRSGLQRHPVAALQHCPLSNKSHARTACLFQNPSHKLHLNY